MIYIYFNSPHISLDEESDCINCMVGKYINETGSDQDSDCIDCVIGKFVNVTGSQAASECIDCPAGKFEHGTGSYSCTECAAGKWSDIVGAYAPSYTW